MNTVAMSNHQDNQTIMDFDPTTLLKQTFPELDNNDIRILCNAATFHEHEAGIELCVEGEIGKTLFVLAKGYVDVLVQAGSHHGVFVDTLGPNTFFGEMAFFGESVRMATIRTRTAVQTLEIEQSDFMRVAEDNPDLLQMLLRQIIGHVRSNDRAVIQELNDKNEALQRAYADLAEQEQLRAQFIATLSHELRTPLTSIQGYLGLINQGAIKGGNALTVAMDSITRNVDAMVGLTNNLLILYEMHPGASEYEYLNLTDVIVQALNVVRETGEVDLTAVNLDINPSLPLIYADKRTMGLAVRALLENAFKFTADKPIIDVRVYRANPAEVAIEVADQGVGIPEEEKTSIFQPFYRLEEEGTNQLFPGLGVGLTIAQFVIERHNGRITLDSAPGEGSTFTIYLPVPNASK
jgi:signal transduction histidine kinase